MNIWHKYHSENKKEPILIVWSTKYLICKIYVRHPPFKMNISGLTKNGMRPPTFWQKVVYDLANNDMDGKLSSSHANERQTNHVYFFFTLAQKWDHQQLTKRYVVFQDKSRSPK